MWQSQYYKFTVSLGMWIKLSAKSEMESQMNFTCYPNSCICLPNLMTAVNSKLVTCPRNNETPFIWDTVLNGLLSNSFTCFPKLQILKFVKVTRLQIMVSTTTWISLQKLELLPKRDDHIPSTVMSLCNNLFHQILWQIFWCTPSPKVVTAIQVWQLECTLKGRYRNLTT